MGNAVAWLANKLHEFGVVPEPGHVILSGSFIKAIPFAPGDTVMRCSTASASRLRRRVRLGVTFECP